MFKLEKVFMNNLRILFIIVFLVHLPVFGGSLFNLDSGTRLALSIEEKGYTIKNSGDWYALSKISVSADSLSGNGLLDAPYIEIDVNTFTFSGTIRCSGNCRIRSQEDFDPSIFTFEGPGKLVIEIGDERSSGRLANGFSVGPVTRMLMEYPMRHPIMTGIYGAAIAGAIAVTAYKNKQPKFLFCS